MKNTRTLLINYHDNSNIRPIPREAEGMLQVYPSLGLGYLASYLRSHKYPVEILDAGALGLNSDEFGKKVSQSGADIAAITSTTIGWPGTVEAIRIIRKILPGAKIVVGGPHLSVFPRESISTARMDIGVIGDGEETLLEIAKNLEEGISLENIAGTIVFKNGEIKLNRPRPWIEDISDLPHPAVDLMPLKKYHCLTVEKPFFTMISSRGCPFKCGFCSQVYCGDTVRFRTPEDLVDEIETYVRDYNTREIIMFDETFTLDEARVLKICRLINKKKLNFRWNIRTRVDTITEEMLISLRKAGCYGLHMGVESGAPRILKIMKKGISLDQIRYAFKLAKKHGFMTRGYFMIGYLDEDRRTYKQTIDLARELNLDWVSFSITTPLPATDLLEESSRRGLVDPEYWKKYTLLETDNSEFPIISSNHWDRNELKRMMGDAYFSFYMRPSYILQRLFSIKSYKQLADLFRGLKIMFMVGK